MLRKLEICSKIYSFNGYVNMEEERQKKNKTETLHELREVQSPIVNSKFSLSILGCSNHSSAIAWACYQEYDVDDRSQCLSSIAEADSWSRWRKWWRYVSRKFHFIPWIVCLNQLKDPQYEHVSLVHDLFVNFLESQAFHPNTMKKYVDASFITQVLFRNWKKN